MGAKVRNKIVWARAKVKVAVARAKVKIRTCAIIINPGINPQCTYICGLGLGPR